MASASTAVLLLFCFSIHFVRAGICFEPDPNFKELDSGVQTVAPVIRGYYSYFTFCMAHASSFVITAQSQSCETNSPFNVFVRLNGKPCREHFDYQATRLGEQGHYHVVITPPPGTRGSVNIGVLGLDTCDVAINATFGPSVCTTPEPLAFCKMINFPVVNENLAHDGLMQTKDAYARYMHDASVKSVDDECNQAMRGYLCAHAFRACDAHGYAQPPCSALCQEYASTCDINPALTGGSVFNPFKPACFEASQYAEAPNCTTVPLTPSAASTHLQPGVPVVGEVSEGVMEYYSFDFNVTSGLPEAAGLPSYVLSVYPADVCDVSQARGEVLNIKILYGELPFTKHDVLLTHTDADGSYRTLQTPTTGRGKYYIEVSLGGGMAQPCPFELRVTWGADLCTAPRNMTFCNSIKYPVLNEELLLIDGLRAKDVFVRAKIDEERNKTDNLCATAMTEFLCARAFMHCHEGVLLRPCRSTCLDYASSCAVNPYGPFEDMNVYKPGCENYQAYFNDENNKTAGHTTRKQNATCTALPTLFLPKPIDVVSSDNLNPAKIARILDPPDLRPVVDTSTAEPTTREAFERANVLHHMQASEVERLERSQRSARKRRQPHVLRVIRG